MLFIIFHCEICYLVPIRDIKSGRQVLKSAQLTQDFQTVVIHYNIYTRLEYKFTIPFNLNHQKYDFV